MCTHLSSVHGSQYTSVICTLIYWLLRKFKRWAGPRWMKRYGGLKSYWRVYWTRCSECYEIIPFLCVCIFCMFLVSFMHQCRYCWVWSVKSGLCLMYLLSGCVGLTYCRFASSCARSGEKVCVAFSSVFQFFCPTFSQEAYRATSVCWKIGAEYCITTNG
jgi:hypothetical protein